MHRRTLLASGALGWSIIASSVLGAPSTTQTEQTPRGKDAGQDDEDLVTNRGTDPARPADLPATQYVTTATPPDWWTDGDDVGGDIEYFETEADAREQLDIEAVAPERRDTVDEFVSETPFDHSRLFYIASVGPSTVYDTIEVSDIDEPNTETIAKATVKETGEAGGRAGAALTFPSALMRQSLGTGRSDTVAVRIVDGWGDEHEVQVSLSDH